MKCVTNTSPLSWLGRIGRLGLLPELYDEIYAPTMVFKQLKDHDQTRDFVSNYVTPINLSDKEKRRFNKVARRWHRKLGLDDIAEVEVFIAYQFFLNVDEMLFANKQAEEIFGAYGKVRDIADIPELAEELGKFTRNDSIRFLEELLRLNPPYRTPYVTEKLMRLR